MYDHIIAHARKLACDFLELPQTRQNELRVLAFENSSCPTYSRVELLFNPGPTSDFTVTLSIVLTERTTKITRLT